MEHLNKLTTLICAIIFIISCKKYKVESYPMTSLTAVNAIVGGTGMKIGSQANVIENSNFLHFSLLAGSNDLYVWPVDDSLHPYYSNSKFVTQDREMYSLYVCGQVGNTEGVLVKEEIPYRTDSTAGIRFINLSPNSTPLNITLSTSPTVNEVSGLGYKQYTEFKTYPSLYNSSYTFEIRDGSTASPAMPLATFSLMDFMMPRYSNITLVIQGLVGSTPELQILMVNNDR